MLKLFNSFSRIVVFTILIIIIAVVFETSQQLYYVKRYDINDDATFFGILRLQLVSWFIWVLLGFLLSYFIKSDLQKKLNRDKIILRYLFYLLSSVIICILLISINQLIISEASFSMTLLFKEFIPFYAFQKVPVYTLGYIALIAMTHLYVSNQQLHIQVLQLSELKNTHLKMYEQLRHQIDDKASVLNIKIGNSLKIIPIETIIWIEADDYCVKVYSKNNNAYTMRSSLKALQEKLGYDFLRVHRKAIVNMKMVKRVNLSDSDLTLFDDTVIPISKSNLKLVKQYSA